MPRTAGNDELVMRLVENALATPPEEREAFLRRACEGDTALFDQTWTYVLWEQRMNGFLLDPVCSRPDGQHPFAPGDLLDGRFRIVREVAQGGMGIVYEARDQKLERRIALKCAKIGFGKRLPPEVRNASEISHPNVCKIYEIHTTPTDRGAIDFITMEFLDGETLTERLNRGPLPDKEVRTIALQVCAGLAEAHRNQVIHGDLKSNNIFVTNGADGKIRAVITDFGLARRPEASQHAVQSGSLVGTPDYMAPELWQGKKASITSDIYALGVILHELITGKRPQLYTEQRAPKKLGSVHPKWDRILQRCVDPDPLKRYQRVEDLSKALAPFDTRLWLMASAAAGLLAIASGLITYETATAPQESVRLAVLPFTSVNSQTFLSEVLSKDIANQVAQLRGNDRTDLTVIPLQRAIRSNVDTIQEAKTVLEATHVLHGSFKDENGKLRLHAYITDARTQINTKEWKADYAQGETRYLPVALAGMVTGTFRLPALSVKATVNALALQDYLNGLNFLQRDSGTDSALACLERAVAADPDSPLTHAALGEAQWFKYYLTRDEAWLERAKQSVRQAERRNPDVAQVHNAAGLVLGNSGFYELAATGYQRAIQLDPNNSDAHRRLGRAYQRSNQLEDSLAAYKRAVELDPNHYRNHQALGSFYFDQSEYEEAMKHWKRTIELAPQEPAARFVLAGAYLVLGHITEAEKELRTGLTSGEDPKLLQALGTVLMYERRYQEAIPNFLRANAIRPDGHLLWTHLGNCYRRTNAIAEAQKAHRHALDLADKQLTKNPRDGTARSILAYLCASLGDRKRAESEIAQALYHAPKDAETRWWAAMTYEALGRRDETLVILGGSERGLISSISRWPELADLHQDSRFKDLLQRHPNN
ncbi:MAG TPA: tetratricopeptide repeat protein [Bryobacteraceae bacterium]|nr:tetratricopeptide repeat protein [Bryobacteraceae bacterium]